LGTHAGDAGLRRAALARFAASRNAPTSSLASDLAKVTEVIALAITLLR
jgi:hypothetical protein